jgi:hypothetical protein
VKAISARAIYAWIVQHWPRSGRELVRQYGGLAETAPLVISDLAALCFAERSTFVPGDPHQSAFNAGMQEVWHHIRDQLNVDPDKLAAIYLLMEEDNDDD